MRAYTVAATAVTLKVAQKWVDNALSHHRIPGVIQTRQGVSRRLTPQAVVTLEIALRLIDSLSLPLTRALGIAAELARAGGPAAQLALSDSAALIVNVRAIEEATHARLAQAVEVTPSPSRGRPRK